ncbi:MAG: hypothetical protein AAF573_15365 [Bacteroidota bacterium]
MKNRLHLHGTLGLIFIGVGVFITFFSMLNIYKDWYYLYAVEPYELNLSMSNVFFFCLGVAHLLIGGGLLGKVQWFSKMAVVLFAFNFMGWSYVVYEVFSFRTIHSSDFWLETGLTVTVYMLLILGLFFLGNEKVRQEFKDAEDEIWDEKILDI